MYLFWVFMCFRQQPLTGMNVHAVTIVHLLFEAFGAFRLVVVDTSMPCLLFVCVCSTHGLLKKSTTLL